MGSHAFRDGTLSSRRILDATRELLTDHSFADLRLEQLAVLMDTAFSPQQHIIHKPTKAGTGQALKLQLRLKPKWVPSANGGFFGSRPLCSKAVL